MMFYLPGSNNRREAYISLYTGLRENGMNQLAGETKQWVQKSPTQVTTTPDEREFLQDCIPVGGIPPARCPYLPACSAPVGWQCLVRGEGGLVLGCCLVPGLPGPGGAWFPGGVPAWSRGSVVSQHALRQTPHL